LITKGVYRMFRNWRGFTLISRWLLICLVAMFPVAGHALALGKLKVRSALNEPLNAEIDFASVTDKELKGVSVTLAPRSDFDTAGVERVPFLADIKFTIDRKSDGQRIIRLRTDQQINEPFLHFLLKVEWPGGLLVREYTALIDPPYKVAGKAAPVETPVVTAPQPQAAAPEPEVASTIPEVEFVPMQQVPASPPPQVAEAPPVEMVKPETPSPAQPEEQKAPQPPAEAVPPKEEVAKAPPASEPGDDRLGPPNLGPSPAPEESAGPKVEPLEATAKPEPTPEAQPAPTPEIVPTPAPTMAQMSDYAVKKGDTLWEIAEKARTDNRDVSIEQMILAIYRTNRDAFFGNNVNNLKAGKILKMPEREETASVTAPDAHREFRAQYNAWQEYKLKLASSSNAVKVAEAPEVVPTPAPEMPKATEAKKEAPSKASKTAPAPTDKGKQDELLKIVRSTLQKDKTTPDQNVAEKESAKEATAREQQALSERAATLEESLESKRLENKDLNEKIGLVRSQLKKESRLIELESQSLAQQPKPAEPKPTETKPAEVAPKKLETAALPTPKPEAKAEPLPPAKPAPAPKKRVAPPPPPPAEKDFLATVLEAVQSDLLMPAVIGVVVLLAGGIALVYFRRRQKSIAEFEESILSADGISTDQPATTGTVVGQQVAAASSGDTSFLSDFSQGGMGNIHTDEVDPIAEAEVYLAYGRDETAEEILKEAMVKHPDRQEIKLKLLEIYHQRNDVSAFETLAEEVYSVQGGKTSKIWNKVEEMGRKLNPENPMFRGGAPAKSAASTAPKMGTDSVSVATTATTPGTVDFSPGGRTTTKTELADDNFDFDIEKPSATEVPASDSGDDFSVMMPESSPKTAAEPVLDSVVDMPKSSDGGLDFDIGGDESSATSNEINFEMDESVSVSVPDTGLESSESSATTGESNPQWDEAATKLDLAKAYIDMGDAEGARSILQEVMEEGSAEQKEQAQELSSQIA